ncbi:MAG TPA: PhzF family phenazine biosynthesis protein [Xanthobacteraceae bacterium]|nr:PhzF family phenazine biosynthesis protein [Xanthobacteraceae bacterium]
MRRRFVTLDVFTSQRFAGNPLAVVLDAQGLDGAAMQAVAREFNLSETVFVLPPEDPANRARARIFTPMAELPFAGHPTVGTAVLLNRIDQISGSRDIVLEEGIGPVRCTVEAIDQERGRARFALARLPEPAGTAAPNAAIAAALGLDEKDIGFDKFVPGRWSAGNAFTFVPLAGLDAMRRARAELARWSAGFGDGPGSMAYMFCGETVERGATYHVRMFAPGMGVPEDPATGSGAAALAGVIAHFTRPPDGAHEVDIEQGLEMGRPSLIRLSMTVRDGRLVAGAIAGEAVVVSEGAIEA